METGFAHSEQRQSIEINMGTDYIFRYTGEIGGAEPDKPRDSNRSRSRGWDGRPVRARTADLHRVNFEVQ